MNAINASAILARVPPVSMPTTETNPYRLTVARLWGRLKAQAQLAGHALGQASQTNDLWVCATAIYYDAPLLTLNRRHFEGFPGLVVLS